MARVPLRLRITLWVVAISGAVQITLSLLIILYHRENIEATNQRRLADAARSIAAQVQPDSQAGMSDLLAKQIQLRWFGRVAAIDSQGVEAARIIGPFGTEAFDRLRSATFEGDFGAPGQREAGRANGFYFAAEPYRDSGRLILATPVDEANLPVRTIAMALVLLLPAGIVASGVSAWYIAGLAVRPIRQMQHFAEELSADNVQDSLNLEDSAPELDALRDELGLAMRRISAGYDAQARFLANVSHEIKTPISVVRTEGEVLMAGRPTIEELRDFAHTTVEEMDRLGRMVESFLLLTRIRQGKGSVQAKGQDANDILMDAVAGCSAMAKQYGVRLDPQLYDGEQPPKIEGNADLLGTALGNLIRNAIRFSPRDTAVRISASVRNQRVIIRVRDYGPGVPPEVMEHLFEPFTQSVEERRRGRGTGLGLQIAHGIAELHNGEVRVRNLKQGCEFSLHLRMAPEIAAANNSQDETDFT
ncbi:MAG: sensor histidine kinase [Phycisphaerales bacterium JB060]